MTKKLSRLAACILAACLAPALHADDNARFDLVGPKIDIRVTRGATTLPIAQVPNLLAGDKIWIKADLPTTQRNHLLIIVAFLRGTTNEPPDNWFTEIDTWEKKQVEGSTVIVPAEAQQALIFVAPETGGDFKTLRSAVKGRPGLFIRADSDLNEASFEQQRIEHYLAAMKTVPQDDPKAIQDRSAKLAATLALKPNADCFKQPVDQQVTCLTQSKAPILLEDGHGQGIAEALTTGASSDFVNAASATQAAGAGLYSAYVGAVVDLVHLVSLLRTAQYQYIPAISFPLDATLNLKLNTPPSFINPKSVIVIGLPAIQKVKLPPLRPHNPNQVACLLQPKMPLLLEGAPLVFSTSFAHDLTLHLNRTGAPSDLPLTPDAFEGGLVVTQDAARKPLPTTPAPGPATEPGKPEPKPASPTDTTLTGTVRGFWGFDSFDGPTLTLQQVNGKDWKITGNPQLMAGQDNHLTLTGEGTGCVQHIALTNDKEKDVDVTYKPGDEKDSKHPLALDVALQKVQPGTYSLRIQQYGDANQDKVPVTAYTADIHLEALKIHTGDSTAELTGHSLESIVSVEVAGQTFTPTGQNDTADDIHLKSPAPVSPANGAEATAKLKDGRSMPVKISAEAPRPGLQLLSFKATPTQAPNTLPVTLGAKDDIPLAGKLTFVVQTKEVFPRTQTIEVATADSQVHTSLSLAENTLILQDEHTAVASLDPLKAFGQSAFGKLQMRPVAADGTTGAWTPLGTLVRTPQITGLDQISVTSGPDPAPASAAWPVEGPSCAAHGSNLFLVQASASDKGFNAPTEVPTGFADATLIVPCPADGRTLYLKLRDDPSAVASVTLPTPIPKATPPSPAEAAPAQTPTPDARPALAASPVEATQPPASTPGQPSSAPLAAPPADTTSTPAPASTPAAPTVLAPNAASSPAPTATPTPSDSTKPNQPVTPTDAPATGTATPPQP